MTEHATETRGITIALASFTILLVIAAEHESEETFMAMHLSDERQKARAKVEPLRVPDSVL